MTNAQLIFLCLVIFFTSAAPRPSSTKWVVGVLGVILWLGLCLWEKPTPVSLHIDPPTYAHP